MSKKILFRQASVYRWITKQESVTSVSIAEHFGLSTTAAQKLLERLWVKGCVKRDNRRQRNVVWTAVAGCKPEDWRGVTEGSHRALIQYSIPRNPLATSRRRVRIPSLAEQLLRCQS